MSVWLYGSVIISFFVNPWWSAFIVLALGFIGYVILASILKVHSQIVSGLLIIASFILISIYVFGDTNTSGNLDHFKASIDFSNEATKISNQGPPFETIDKEAVDKMIDYKKQALKEAKQVDIEILNQRLDGFGDHFKDEFVTGLETLIDGHENYNPNKFVQGQILLDQWGTWYSYNLDRIKKGK